MERRLLYFAQPGPEESHAPAPEEQRRRDSMRIINTMANGTTREQLDDLRQVIEAAPRFPGGEFGVFRELGQGYRVANGVQIPVLHIDQIRPLLSDANPEVVRRRVLAMSGAYQGIVEALGKNTALPNFNRKGATDQYIRQSESFIDGILTVLSRMENPRYPLTADEESLQRTAINALNMGLLSNAFNGDRDFFLRTMDNLEDLARRIGARPARQQLDEARREDEIIKLIFDTTGRMRMNRPAN